MMCKKRIIYSFVGVMTLVIGLTFAGISAKAVTKTVLKQVGTIQDQSGSIKMNSEDYLYTKSGNEVTLLDPMGNPVPGAVGGNIKNSNGYTVLVRKGKLLNECAVYTKDGKEMIPYGPAVVEKLNDRFWLTGYALKETKDKEEALIYSSDKMFSITPDEEDKLYTGELTVVDMTTGKEVPGVKVTSPKAKIEGVADSLLVRDVDGSSKIYDASGKVLAKDAGSYTKLGNRYFMQSESGKYQYYDCSLKALFNSDQYYTGIQDTDYLYLNGDKNCTLIDRTGKSLFTTKTKGNFGAVQVSTNAPDALTQDLVTYTDSSNSEYPEGLYKADGTEILKPAFKNIIYFGYGYVECTRKKGNDTVYDVYDVGGNLIGEELENFTTSARVAYKEVSNGVKNYYIYNKKAYALTLKNANPMGIGFIRSTTDNYTKKGLYDAFTGECLLKEEYDNISYVNGKIYADKDGVITIYDVIR